MTSRALKTLGCALFLLACGGGGSPEPAVLQAPAILSTSTNSFQKSITVFWLASAGATSYNVYYSTSAGLTTANGIKVTGATHAPPITGTQFTLTGLAEGTYSVLVTAVGGGTESAASATRSASLINPLFQPFSELSSSGWTCGYRWISFDLSGATYGSTNLLSQNDTSSRCLWTAEVVRSTSGTVETGSWTLTESTMCTGFGHIGLVLTYQYALDYQAEVLTLTSTTCGTATYAP